MKEDECIGLETFDKIWEEIHQEQDWGKYPAEEVIRFVARNYYRRDRKATRLLDAGCGAGAVVWYMAREGFDAFGFDGSATAVRKAQNRLADEGLYAKLMVCDAAKMNYESEYFDGIVDSAMIYGNTTENIKAILREFYRVLKKSGRIFSTGLFKAGMTGYQTGVKLEENTYRELTEGSLTHRGTVHFFNQMEAVNLWEKAGFTNIQIDSLDRTEMGGRLRVSYYMIEAEKG